jgi:hypothetical protein
MGVWLLTHTNIIMKAPANLGQLDEILGDVCGETIPLEETRLAMVSVPESNFFSKKRKH